MKNNLAGNQFRLDRFQQTGAVLVMSLIFLIILTFVGVSALDATKLQTRLAANAQTVNCAFQVANMGLDYAFEGYQNNLQGITGRVVATESLNDIKEDEWNPPSLNPSPNYRGDSGEAQLRIKQVITSTGTGGRSLYFIVESKGSCQNAEKHYVTLLEGWTLDKTQNNEFNSTDDNPYIDLPSACYRGLEGSDLPPPPCPEQCLENMTDPACQVDSCFAETASEGESNNEPKNCKEAINDLCQNGLTTNFLANKECTDMVSCSVTQAEETLLDEKIEGCKTQVQGEASKCDDNPEICKPSEEETSTDPSNEDESEDPNPTV